MDGSLYAFTHPVEFDSMGGLNMATRIEFNSEGFKQILNLPETEQLVLSEAQAIATRAGEGFEAHSRKAGTRYIAFVGTTDRQSCIAEAENKVLSRAVIPNG